MVDDFDEVVEEVSAVAEYFTELTGRSIDAGVDADLDIWIESSRTNGREYLESVNEVERRLRLLYSDLILDDEYDSGLDAF
jgi:ABC-type tungstate transport system permease subunit